MIFDKVLWFDLMVTSSGLWVTAMNGLLALLGHEGNMLGMFALANLTFALIWRSMGLGAKIRKMVEGE